MKNRHVSKWIICNWPDTCTTHYSMYFRLSWHRARVYTGLGERGLQMDLTEQHHVDLDGLSANLELLLNNQETADVVFVIGPDEMVFCAHKLILWTR